MLSISGTNHARVQGLAMKNRLLENPTCVPPKEPRMSSMIGLMSHMLPTPEEDREGEALKARQRALRPAAQPDFSPETVERLLSPGHGKMEALLPLLREPMRRLELRGVYFNLEEFSMLFNALCESPHGPAVVDLSVNGIRDDCIDFVSQWLRRDKHTTELNLWGNYVRIAGVSSIVSHLATNRTLTSLNLGANDMGSGGAYPIAEALRTNSPPSLKMLDISSNPFGVTSGHLLAEAMMSNSTLVSLNLHNCGLGNESIPSVAAFISTNRTLKFLQLSKNGFGRGAIASLAPALADNNGCIQELVVGMNRFPCNEIAPLLAACHAATLSLCDLTFDDLSGFSMGSWFRALATQTSITTLKLAKSVWYVKEDGPALESFLKTNTTLTSLDIRCHRLGGIGTKFVADGLAQNTTLRSLDMSEAPIGDKACQLLIDMIQTNSTLTELNFSDTTDRWREVQECLDQNYAMMTI